MKHLFKHTPLAALLIIGIFITVNSHAQSFLTNGLVAYYPFNGNANDASGHGNNATNITATITEDRFGNPNHAYLFSAGTDKIETPFPGIVGSNPRTITLWVKRSNSTQQFTAFSFEGAGNGHHFLGIFNRNQIYDPCQCWPIIYTGVGVDTGNAQTVYGTDFDTAKWEFYAWVVPSKPSPAIRDIQIFKNGTPLTNLNFFYNNANLLVNTDPAHLIIGGNMTVEGGDGVGILDDVRIYNRALSTNEVAQLYAIESAPIVGLAYAVKPTYSNLAIGTNYQLQVSGDLNIWTNQGAVFTATNNSMVSTQYFDVATWNQLFFRVKMSP